MGRRVFTAILPGVSLPPYLSTISTAAVVSSTSFSQKQGTYTCNYTARGGDRERGGLCL